jgi:type II secretory pathway component PulJ
MKRITPASQTKRTRLSSGLTTVEIVIAIVVSAIILTSVISFIITLSNQYAITSVQTKLTNDLTESADRISRDIRDAHSVLASNAISDSAAPSSPGYWQSNSSQLVLASTARRTNGQSVNGEYPGVFDNIVFYVRNGALYKRILAYNHSNNRYSTITCTPLTGGGCAGDMKVLDNVSSLSISYLAESGSTTSPVTNAKTISITVQVSVQQSGQTITSSSTFKSTLR